MEPIRRGGRAATVDGGRLTWSQAEGVRGTRWREATELGGVLVRTVLLEVSPTGRPTRLEIATVDGLLTLHPGPDESALHGNVVAPGGVRHLAFAWSPLHELIVGGSAASIAVTVGRLSGVIDVGGTAVLEAIQVDDALEPMIVRRTVTRTADRGWLLAAEDGRDAWLVTLDTGGNLVLPDGVTWSLED